MAKGDKGERERDKRERLRMRERMTRGDNERVSPRGAEVSVASPGRRAVVGKPVLTEILQREMERR